METAAIQILPETKNRISIENYTELPGTRDENILCALLVNTCASTIPITPDSFLYLYNWFAVTLHKGIKIDFSKCPSLENSQLVNDALRLKGYETDSLLNRNSCTRIANLISNENEVFAKELDFVYTNFEAKLILSAFMPGCAV